MIKRIKNYFFTAFWAYLTLCCASTFAQDENSATQKTSVAVFAGGCFWCMEPPFDALTGVLKTISGYTGGSVVNPTYEAVSQGNTGHLEAVEVTYDPAVVSYEKLLEVFWQNIDPFDNEGQFCDKGDQYKAVIFYLDEGQKQSAESSKEGIVKKLGGKPITTAIKPAGKFYPAEDYHQDYYLKNPLRYKFYRYNCGRDQRLGQVWGKAK